MLADSPSFESSWQEYHAVLYLGKLLLRELCVCFFVFFPSCIFMEHIGRHRTGFLFETVNGVFLRVKGIFACPWLWDQDSPVSLELEQTWLSIMIREMLQKLNNNS